MQQPQEPRLSESQTPDATHAALFYLYLMLLLIFGANFVGIILVDLGISPEDQLFTAIGALTQSILVIGFVLILIQSKRFDLKKTLRLRACPPALLFWGVLGVVPLGMLVGQLAQVLVELIPALKSEMLIELVSNSAYDGNLAVYLLYVIAISLGAGISEELAFRGYILRGLESAVKPWGAVLISALVFALFHIDPLHILMVFPAGIYLGYLAMGTGSIYPAIVAHAFNNLWSLFETNFWQTSKPEITSEEILFSTWYPTEVLLLAAGILIFALYQIHQHVQNNPKDSTPA